MFFIHFWTLHLKNFQKTLILLFEANSAFSCQSPKGSFFCDLAHYDDSKSDVWDMPFWCLKNKLQPGGTTYNNELQKHCKRNSYLDEMTKFLYFYGIFEQLSYYCVTPLDLDNPHTLMSWPLPKATKETILLFSSR